MPVEREKLWEYDAVAVGQEGTLGSGAGPATMSYVDQVLELSFPLRAFYNGGSLLMRAIEPLRAGDVVTMQAEVTDKRHEGKHRLVTCRIRGLNQRSNLVGLADAILNLPE
jgi:acyl dehydratase